MEILPRSPQYPLVESPKATLNGQIMELNSKNVLLYKHTNLYGQTVFLSC